MNKIRFQIQHSNPLTELSELRLRIIGPDELETHDIHATLKLDCMSLEHGGLIYNVGVSKAFLAMEFGGCESQMGSLYGVALAPSVEVTETKTEQSMAGVSGASNVNISQMAGEVNLNGNASLETQTVVVRKKQITEVAIRSLPNNRWEIRAPAAISGKPPIQNDVLNDTRLCKIDRKQAGNRITASAEIIARKLDIEVEAQGNKLMRQLRLFKNREAIIGLIVAKALVREVAREQHSIDEKVIVISRCNIEENI